MAVRLIVTRESGGGTDADERRVRRFDAETLTVGGSDACDLRLPGLPAAAMILDHDHTGRGRLRRRAAELDVRVNGETVTTETRLANGDVITVDAYRIGFFYEFAAVGQRPVLALMSRVTVTLLTAILLGEVFIIGWLPRRVQVRRFWGGEVARQQTGALVDEVRGRIQRNQSAAPDELTAAALTLLGEEVDRIALYLRRNIDALNAQQLVELQHDLQTMQGLVARAEEGALFPPAPGVNMHAALRRLLTGSRSDVGSARK